MTRLFATRKNSVFKKTLAVGLAVFVFASAAFYHIAFAANLTALSDTMSSVKTSAVSNHTIKFTTPTGAGDATDTITITFPSGFTIGSVDYTDIDLSHGASTGYETEETLAATADGTSWGASFGGGQTLTLTHPTNAANGDIASNDKVIVEIGLNASGGNAQIQNPGAGTHVLAIAGTFNDTGQIAVAIVADDQVVVSVTVDPYISLTLVQNSVTLTKSGGGNPDYQNTGFNNGTANTLAVNTNATSGYTLTYNGATLASGGNSIDAMAAKAASSTGTEQFGINLKDNATPNTGTNPSGEAELRQAITTRPTNSNSFPAPRLPLPALPGLLPRLLTPFLTSSTSGRQLNRELIPRRSLTSPPEISNPMQKISPKTLRKTSILLSFILFIAGFSFYFQSASAQTGDYAQGMNISPPLTELTLQPGTESEQTIRVTNATENLLELYPAVMNFEARGEGGEPNFYPPSEENRKFSLARWISLSQSKIALTPRQEIVFKYNIKVPFDAEPGGHYGVVLLGTAPPEADKSISQVAIAGQVGSLVLVRVPGNIQEIGSLDEFSAPWFFFRPPVPFTTFVQNKGNTHFNPEGEITIRNWRGKEMERIPVNPKKGNILPESRRRFDTEWNPARKPFWKIPIGRFSANLKVAYGLSGKTFGSKIYFWIIPWWVIIAVILLIIAIVIFLIFRRRRKKPGNFHPPSKNLPVFHKEIRAENNEIKRIRRI